MAFHCYQPVFNFDGEFENAYQKAYLPLLEMFERYPGIRASFHYPGNMIEWFRKDHPEYIDKLRKALSRGQIEMLGGCYYEPVMSIIPEEDRKAQMEKNSAIMRETFNSKPRGAWLAERVWDPELVDTLIESDIEYTILDDNHLLRAGAVKEDLFRPWNIEEKTGDIVIFPANKTLRYLMPFRSPGHVLEYMKKILHGSAGDKCLFFADDGEKFGAWPHTYKLVYQQGWLDRFFSLLRENSETVETCTYSEILDTVSANRIKNLPPSSYSEMMEWSKGDFTNFFKKYPEADRMHKRMIYISGLLKEAGETGAKKNEDPRIEAAKTELYKSQSGCAYWHGTFGGVYLPHLRAGVYHHLIRAKGLIEGDKPSVMRSAEYDMEGGYKETVIGNDIMDIFLSSLNGGGISELDHKPRAVNLVNSMSRVKEQYHNKVKWRYFQRIAQARRAITQGMSADIHDALGVGERGLKKFLHYDRYVRNSFITHIFDRNVPFDKMYAGISGDDSFLKGAYDLSVEAHKDRITGVFSKREKIVISGGKALDIGVEKKVQIDASQVIDLTHTVRDHTSAEKDSPIRCAIEFNFLIWDEKRMNRPFFSKTKDLVLKDRYSGSSLTFSFDREKDVLTYPVYSVNETEMGLKKTFQGMSVIVGGANNSLKTGLEDSIGIRIRIE